MDQPRVLVTSVSRMGSTAEIAEVVAERLSAAGLEVDVVPTREVRSLEPYGAVVLGSAVYLSRWQREALTFLRRFGTELSRRPVWLFQSGPLDLSAEQQEIPLPRPVAAHAAGIHVRGHATFGGRIDPSRAEGLLARSMARGGMRDFRNFEQIRAWGDRIADELRSRSTAA
jgi:menaquinone-dependent protoporphyrinogen oxidase